MKRAAIAWFVLGALCVDPSVGQVPLQNSFQPIVNGVLTSSFPSVGLLLIESGDAVSSCTGTLIGCRTVLTAAHCFCGDDTPGSLCQPSADSGIWFQHALPSLISEVVIHPDYLFAERSDLAIVRLESPVSGLAPVPINTSGRPPHGTPGVIAGFGKTAGDAEDAGLKRAGVVATAPCQVANPDTHVCWNFLAPLGNPGEDSSTCQGDSGGPLLVDLGAGMTVGGVTSGVLEGCVTPNNPWQADVFVDRAWILQNGGADLGNTVCGNLPPAGGNRAPIQSASGFLGPGNLEDTKSFTVSANTSRLLVVLNGEEPLANDFDLAIRRGSAPAPGQFDCRSATPLSLELCQILDPAPGTWFATANRFLGEGGYQMTVTTFESPTTSGPCVEGPNTLCLVNDRFRVEVDWRTPQGTSGKGNAQELTPDTGYFWFFEQSNVEMVIKVLDACSFADRFWVFAGGLTNVEVDIQVTDTVTGDTVPYTNPLGTPFQPIQDTNAFATCP